MDSSENKIETFTATDHLNENSGGPLITVQINVIVICGGSGKVFHVHSGITVDENEEFHPH